jgi:hypothetical protein
MSRPIRVLALAALAGVAQACVAPAQAEDTSAAPATVSEPIPSAQAALPPPAPKSAPGAAVAKRPAAAPAHPAPVQTTAVIPPAPTSGRLSPPPEARGPLPLETNLQPLAPLPATPGVSAAPPTAPSPAR